MPGLRVATAIVLLHAAPALAADARTLPLDEALRTLDGQSLTLRQARSRLTEASGIARQVLAGTLPTLTATGGYTRNSAAAQVTLPPITGAPVGGIVIQPLDAWAAGGTLRVPIVVPTIWAEVAAARRAEESTAATIEAIRLDVRRTFIQVAWTGAAGEEMVAATERAVASADEQARSAQRALDAGTGVPLSVLQAKTEAVRRRSDLVRVRAELDRARLAAGVLLGVSEPLRILVPRAMPSSSQDARALVDEATTRRPELRATAAQVESAQDQLTAARLRWLPQLSASGSAFAQDVIYPTGQKDGWRVTLDLVWPLYDGGARYGRARQAEGAIEGAQAAQEAERLAVIQDVEDSVRDLRVAQERLDLAEQQVGLATEAATIARRGFAGGIASSLDVLDANDRLYQSEVGLADARARLGTALATVDRAVGRS